MPLLQGGERGWGVRLRGLWQQGPLSTHHTGVTMQRRPLEAVPGEKPCVPSWAQRPGALPGGVEGRSAAGMDPGFGEQLPVAFPHCRVPGGV